MSKAKALAQVLLIAAVLVTLCYQSHSNPAAKRKAYASRESKWKTARKAHRTRKKLKAAPRTGSLVYTVTATTYQAVPAQTDSRPFVTADNSTIRRGYSSRLRWLAVSRDLLRPGGGRLHFGDRVRVRGVSPRLDGIYTVHDTMHKRHRHRIDILSSPREKLWLATPNVKLQLVDAAPACRPNKLAGHHPGRDRRVASRPARNQLRKRAERPAYLAAAIL